METPPDNGGTQLRRRMLKIGAALGAVVLVAAIGFWVLLPWLVDRNVTAQLADLEQRTGLNIDIDSARTTGLSGLQIRELAITTGDGSRTIGTIDEIDADIDLSHTLSGTPAISATDIRGVRAVIHRHADGTTDLDDIRASLAGDDDDRPDTDDESAAGPVEAVDALAERLLGHFAGRYPDVTVTDIDIELTHADGADAWAVSRISSASFSLDGDETAAPFSTQLTLNSPDDPNLVIPDTVDISGVLRHPATTSSLAVDFTPHFRIADLDAFPFAEFGVAGVEITDDYGIELTEPTVDSRLQDTSYQLGSAQWFRIQFARWPQSLADLTVVELEVDAPRLFVEFDANGGSNLTDLYAIAHQPSAHQVADTARSLSDAVALRELPADDDPAPEQADDNSPSGADRITDMLDDLPLREWLIDYVPRRTEIRDLRLVVDDARDHDQLTNPADYFEITGERLNLEHRPLEGILEGDIQLQTSTRDDTASADLQFHLPYRTDRWNASVRIDRLELAHFAQLGGPAVAHHLHGGRISATMDVEHGGDDRDETRTRFDGIFSASDVRVHHEAVADDPIAFDSGRLSFDGFYDATMALPEPELIDDPFVDDDEDENGDTELTIPTEGAFVIEEANARLGEVEADLTLAAYGLDGFELPNRFAVDVHLEQTPLQRIADAVPPAIRGPLDGIELLGSLAWRFHLEVPLYQASDMVWDAHVDLSPDFEVAYIPEEVDVFAMKEPMEHTISDEWQQHIEYQERDVSFQRTIDIPRAHPTPARWLLDNTSLDIEQIDHLRREREWPEIPTWDRSLGISAQKLNQPEFWLTDVATDAAADAPWPEDEAGNDDSSFDFFSGFSLGGDDGDAPDADDDEDELIYEEPEPPAFGQRDVQIDPDRYGDYVYVPLHHISPYMVRAIKTTEDNSFFTHSGFNYLAIRQSVEQNIDAGRYVRGASTISMQLAKNLFLELDRVLSRKLQEITLVWLMESVADVPKSRMMELYLNIIEFGPGIFGINEAAMHYFGKRPDQLNVGEVAWLVSIVPNPKRYHRYYERGEISPHWFRRMRRYIRAMEARDRISEREMEEALEEPPQFYIPEDGDPLLRDDVEPVEPDEIIDDEEVDEELREDEQPLDLPEL